MRRIHYAWIILLVCFVAIAAGTGVRLTFGAFILPWEHDFGTGRAGISAIATLSFLLYGLLQPVVGRWADRRGAGGALAASMVVIAAGLLLLRFATTIWTAGLSFGVVASAGFAGVSSVPAAAAIARWFADRRGLAMALLTLAMSLGQMTLMPAAIFLNDARGWRETMLIFAVGLLVLAPFVYRLVKPDPAALGLRPYGARGAPPDPEASHRAEGRGDLRAVLTTPAFWWLALPFFVCGFTTTGMIDTHLVPFAHDHHLPTGATAAAVALLAGFNSLGILLSGYLTDRVQRPRLLAGLYGARAITLVFLMTVRSPGALLAFSVVFGLVDFSTVPPTSSMAAEIFGAARMGFVYGLISLSHQFGSAAGAFVPGVLYDLTGGYQAAFVLGAATLATGAVLSLWLREPRRRALAAAPA